MVPTGSLTLAIFVKHHKDTAELSRKVEHSSSNSVISIHWLNLWVKAYLILDVFTVVTHTKLGESAIHSAGGLY